MLKDELTAVCRLIRSGSHLGTNPPSVSSNSDSRNNYVPYPVFDDRTLVVDEALVILRMNDWRN